MLSANVRVSQLKRLTQRQLQDLTGVRRKWDVPIGNRIALTDHLLYLFAGGIQFHALGGQGLGGDTVTFPDQAQEEVLGADVIVLQSAGLFLRQHNHPPRTVGKPFEHTCPSL